MEYRIVGKTGLSASRLGFGTTRLPTTTIGEAEYVDFDRAVAALRRAFELGVNYVDCGIGYGNYQAEIAVGRALRDWPGGDQILVTTKAAGNLLQAPGDLRRSLEHQLQKLERDWLDIYQFHGIGWDTFQRVDKRAGWLDDMLQARDEGLVRHVGFSFHDEPQAMIDLIELGWAELVTCQYNYLDRRNETVMAYAAQHGVAIAVMGPVGGGRLAIKPRGAGDVPALRDHHAAELALRFVASNPHVDVVLSGMDSAEMVEQNVAALEHGPLDATQIEALGELMARYHDLANLYCTGCQYCMPCPNHVNIPWCFELYNYRTVYGWAEYAVEQYALLVKGGRDALRCTECEVCLERCPQGLPIPDRLKEVAQALG